MRRLITQDEGISYGGLFSTPAFRLGFNEIGIIEGAYRAFNKYGVGLTDINLDLSDLSSLSLEIGLGKLGDYSVGFEQIEWTGGDIDDDYLARIPEVLQRGEEWLRSAVPDLAFKLHGINYYNHSLLSEGTSQDFLREFSEVDIPGMGTSLGSGLIFHWNLPETGWRMNLTIDSSNVFPGGLFVEQDVIAETDRVDYTKLVVSSQTLLMDAFAKVGLEFKA